MKFVINMVAKFGGVAKLWGFLDGYKTKVAGSAAMLTGLAGLLSQVYSLIEGKDPSAVVFFFKNLTTDPSWLALLGGLGVLGIGNKIEKAEAGQPQVPVK